MAKNEKETKKNTKTTATKKNMIKSKKETKTEKVNTKIKKAPSKVEKSKTESKQEKVKIEKQQETIKKETKKESPIIEVVFLLVSTCIISLLMGYYVCYKMQYRDSIVAKDKYLRKFIDEYQNIKENYYKNIDWRQALDNSMEGLLQSLNDNYAGIITADDTDTFNYNLEGEYEGIGIEVTKINDKMMVTEVIKNTPAFKEGLQIDDEIISINGINLSDKTTGDLSGIIKNTNEKIELIISRDGKEQTIQIAKDKIIIPSVSSEMIDENNKIGYVELGNFSNNTYEILKQQLEELEQKGMKSCIIDLRGNNGGTLQSAYKIASLFLDNKKIIYQIDNKGETTKFYSEESNPKKYPVVILQDESSARGSELFSSALKENKRAEIIGTSSFGKGTVQELYKLDNGSEYKFTTKKWLTVKNKWIEGIGVRPNIEEKASEEYQNNPTRENDNQLKKALDYLTGK